MGCGSNANGDNTDFMGVLPHCYWVRYVGPCHHLDEVYGRSSWLIDLGVPHTDRFNLLVLSLRLGQWLLFNLAHCCDWYHTVYDIRTNST